MLVRIISVVILLLLPLAVSSTSAVAGSVSFEERVAAQRAIEEVYWRHRIWPEINPTPKPPLSAFLSDQAIRAKVVDYLKKSNALETWWHRPAACVCPGLRRNCFTVFGKFPSVTVGVGCGRRRNFDAGTAAGAEIPGR